MAQANAVCREYDELVARAGHNPRPVDVARLLAQARQAQARIRAILTPAASHPRVGALLKDRAAQDELTRWLEGPGQTQALREDLYRARVRVYEDEKAIGLTACLGSHPPRKPIG